MLIRSKKMKILLLLVFFFCLSVAKALNEHDVDMIVSFATLDARATSVLAPYVCWSAYELTSLAKILHNNGISMAASLQPKRSEVYLQNVIVLADLRCRGTDDFLIKASDEGFFKSPYRWLLINQDPADLKILDQLAMLIDSDVVVAQKKGQEYMYVEVYKINENSQIIYNSRALWRPIDHRKNTTAIANYGIVDDYRKSKILATRRMDIRKHTLTMVNVITDSNETRKHMDDRLNLHQDSITKMSYMVVKICFEMMNSTEKLLFSNTWGYVDKNGSWNGIIERLIKKEGDIVYKINENSQIIYNSRALWRPIDHRKNTTAIANYGIVDDYRKSKILATRRMDIRKHTLTMVNVITDSNETRKHMDDRLNLHQDSITKMSYMVVKICFEMMNSTEKLLFSNTWGYVDKNGSWNGIIERLIKKEGDIGTLTIFTQERMRAIDYIAMVGTTAVRFVFREPPLAYVSNIFALPFTGAVWLAVFVCVLACALFLYITSKWEATMGMHSMQLDGSWADVLILIIGAVLQQGCTLEPRHAAGRVVTLLLFIALTILYAAYSANIVVLLRAPSSSVRSLQDVLNSPLKLGASDFSYNRYFFKKLNDPLRKEIYNKKIAPKGKKANFYTMKEGVEKIRKGLFAFHMELNPGYRLIQETYQEDEKCDLVEIDYINEIDPWVPAQKRSPYKDLFKINFIKIRESGIQACIHQRLHVGRPRCLGAVNTFSSVGIMDMYSALLITLYGMFMAPAVLLLEIAYKRLLDIREKRRTQHSSF